MSPLRGFQIRWQRWPGAYAARLRYLAAARLAMRVRRQRGNGEGARRFKLNEPPAEPGAGLRVMHYTGGD
jgi:hypothetical protein